MSSLRKRDEFKFPILSKEMMLRDAEAQKPSEVKVYYLSPEELEKYRKGVNDMPAQIPIPSRDEMIELIKFCKGSINAMAKAKRVGWNTIQRWLDHYGLREEAALMQSKLRLEKHSQQRENGTDAKAITPPQESEGKQETEIGKKETAGALIVSRSGLVVQGFANLHEALKYIEDNCSKKEAREISLYQRVPFSFGVNVVPGEVS